MHKKLYSLIGIGLLVLITGCRVNATTVIRMISWGYTPTEETKPTPQTPFPRQALKYILEEWEKLHPGYKVEATSGFAATGGYERVIETQLKGGTAPHIIFWQPPDTVRLAKKKMLVNMTPYLNKPNHYVPNNEKWKDLFIPVAFPPQNMGPNRSFYYIPYDIFGTAIWYNKDIFKEVGVSVPDTWDEFLKIQEKIQSAGYVPFNSWAMGAAGWRGGVLGPMLYDQKEMIKALDVLKKDGIIDPEEMTRGWKKGIIKVDDPRFREHMKILKDWSKYWNKGIVLTGGVDMLSREIFIKGKVAMQWDTAWEFSAIKNNPLRKFDFGFMWFPRLTKETTPLATGAPAGFFGNPGTDGCITSTAVKDNLVDICADLLMYLTTPTNNERLTQEEISSKTIPAVRGVSLAPEMKSLGDIMASARIIDFGVPWMYLEVEGSWDPIFEMYIKDKIDLNEAIKRMDDWVPKGVKKLIKDNRDWDISKW